VSGVRAFLRRKAAPEHGQALDPEPGPVQRDPDEPLRVAAITVCRDEGRMLPLWIRYYGEQLGVENLYVVDDSSVDGSTDDLPCDVLHIPPVRGGKFESTRMRVLAGLGSGLRALYDCVIFCDVDEFIVPDPDRYSGLRDFVGRQLASGAAPDAVGVLGLNVVHAVETEAPLDLSLPILGQRELAKFLPVMCKPSVNFSGAPWYAASHGIKARYRVDPDLWMFHMKFGDRDHLQEAADHRRRMVEADGRSQDTQWRQGGDTLVDLLERITEGADASQIPEFVPPAGEKLEALVVEDRPGSWRAPKGSQMTLMERRPLVRIPKRFHGIV
jgi:hypothetical protein